MKIAVAGAGDFAHYFVEELLAVGHSVVLLSRTPKPWFQQLSVEFRPTDYSIPHLVTALHDCDGLVSGILDYSLNSATVHLALLEACRQSPKCKKYIPSEYAGNTDEYPDQPVFYYANHEPVRKALRAQTEVKWTLFNVGWLADYFVPRHLRYIKDIGEFHPVDLEQRTLTIPGDGADPVAFTPARDAAKAVARLFAHDDWEEIIYVSGETTTWNRIAEILQARGYQLQVSHMSKEMLEQQEAAAESEDKVIAAQYAIWSVSGAGQLPKAKMERQKEKYFGDVKFRTVEEFLDDAVKLGDAQGVAV
jgi:nucleoside-diphosphate-sugar epimerase